MAIRRRTKPKARCALCGRKFTQNRSDHIYCSKACKVAEYRKRKRAVQQQFMEQIVSNRHVRVVADE